MKKKMKVIPLALVAALATSPFMMAPKAYALSVDDIETTDEETGADADYTISITLDKDLSKGDTVTIKFASDFELDENGDEGDISFNDDDVKNVDIDDSSKEIEFEVTENYDADDEIEINIDNIVTNPEDEDDYTIKVRTENESWQSETIEIVDDSGSSSNDDEFDLSYSGKYTEDETSFTLGEFKLDTKLVEGDFVTITFPTDDMLPSSIDKEDVEINGETPKSVEVSKDNEVKIKVPSDAADTKDLEIVFDKAAGITMPEKAKSNYYFKVKYKSYTYESETFEVKEGSGSGSSSSASDFAVSLSDSAPGARSSYSFTFDLGKTKVSSNSSIEVEFPSSDMIPSNLSTSDITVNGDKVGYVSSFGSRVYLKTPSNFKSDSKVKVVFDYDAFITNPKMPGSDYTLVARAAGKTAKSQKFSIYGSATTPTTPTNPVPTTPTTPTPVPVPVNNSTATIGLTKATLNTPTVININIKALGVQVKKNTDYIEVVMPVGFRVLNFINATAVKVNNVQPSFVATRGQNLIIYPAQDLPAGVPVTVNVAESAGIATPTVKNVYSIGVYTSEERNLLFARPVGVGGAVVPAQPQTPQPNPAIPANAARIKLNVANFTLNGKSYPLSTAPYTLNGNTLVPAQFFKEALALTTTWNNQSVAIISGSTIIKFTIGSNKAKVGPTEVTLPVTIQSKNGMPMLPIRFIADTLKYKTGWDAQTSSVYIFK
ncbi:MAG: copper amine oxidase N-terminal domain-containing protein [Clostridia bacterium]